MKELSKSVTSLLLMGALVGGGVRAAEWLIPAPEVRVVVCAYHELDELECKPAADLLRKK